MLPGIMIGAFVSRSSLGGGPIQSLAFVVKVVFEASVVARQACGAKSRVKDHLQLRPHTKASSTC